jgi:hypothetical protein
MRFFFTGLRIFGIRLELGSTRINLKRAAKATDCVRPLRPEQLP